MTPMMVSRICMSVKMMISTQPITKLSLYKTYLDVEVPLIVGYT